MLPFRGLSVGLSVTFVYCADTVEDINTFSFACDNPCLSQIGQTLPPQNVAAK